MRCRQRSHVHPTYRADVRHRPAVHGARVLNGVRHVARQMRVPDQPQRRRLSARPVPGPVAVLHGGHTAGHRHPMAHLFATATYVVPGKSALPPKKSIDSSTSLPFGHIPKFRFGKTFP